MRKELTSLLLSGIFIVIFSLFTIDVAAAESLENDHDKLFEVQTKSVLMRTAPSEDAELVGELVAGDRLRTFDESEGWVKTFYNGQPVWVYAEELLLLEERQQESEAVDQEEDTPSEQSDGEDTNVEEINKETEENESDEPKHFVFEKYSPAHAVEDDEYLPVGLYRPNEVQISEDTIVVMKNQLNGYSVMIDAGHGGKDSGAISDNVLEKDMTLATAKAIATRLEKEGATVTLTRENDTFISLENRVHQSNTENIDVFISLHYDYFNDSEASGINTYFYHEHSSKDLANKIHTALAEELDMKDRGFRKESYYVLRNTHKPAVLLELGFMTNPDDLEKIQSDDYKTEVAEAITNGLIDYFEKETE